MRVFAGWGIVCALAIAAPAVAQHHPQAAIGVPFNTASDSFFEQTGVNFGLHGHNFFFQQHAFGAAAPQFGGANPQAGLNTGFGFQLPGGIQGDLNIVASQGSQQSLTGSAISTTIPDGGGGGFFAGTATPFVTSVLPVAGDASGFPTWNSPLQERLERLHEAGSASYGIRPGSAAAKAAAKNASKPAAKVESSASAPAAADDLPSAPAASKTSGGPTLTSVEELRGQRAAAASVELQAAEALAEKAKEAEASGKTGVARIYYQQAAHRAGDSPRKAEWAARAAALSPPSRSGR
jgi:hypothetical protein